METPPLIVAPDMGYGHLRAAAALAALWGTSVTRCDRPPLAAPGEERTWRRTRALYEWCTRHSTHPLWGGALRPVVRRLTALSDVAAPGAAAAPYGVRHLERAIARGLGAGLVRHLAADPRPLLATYFAPAIAADAAGLGPVWLVVTDSEVHRVWAPRDAARGRIGYLVPAERTRARLCAYGVPPERIVVTGFPLPPGLVGADDAIRRRHHARRRARLGAGWGAGTAPLELTFAIGGAGAQVPLAEAILRALRRPLAAGRVRLTLVAGLRSGVATRLARVCRSAPRGAVEILHAPTLAAYLEAFDRRLTSTDLLWTKPSELTFYAALGLPILLAPPVGEHEARNAALLRDLGAGLDPAPPEGLARWLEAGLEEGRFEAAARAGLAGLPADGAWRIRAALAGAGPWAPAPTPR